MTVLSANIQANTTGFKSAVESAKRELELFNKSNKALAQTMRGCNDVTDLQISAFSKSVNALEKATAGTKTYKQSAALLEKELQKLKQQWSNLSDKAKQGEFGRYMSQSITQTKAKIAELNAEMAKPTKSWGELAGQMNVAGVNVGDFLGKLKSLNPAVLGVAGAAKVMTDAFRSSETAMDGARRTMSGLQSVYDSFIRSVRDGGLGSGSILGAFKLGQDTYDAEDAFGTLMGMNKGVYAQLEADIARARELVMGGNGKDADLDKLAKGIEDKYSKIIEKQTSIVDKKIKQLAGNDEERERIIREIVFGADPDSVLESVGQDAKRLAEEASKIYSEQLTKGGVRFQGGQMFWTNLAAKGQYDQLKLQSSIRSSLIDSESVLIDIVSKTAELNQFKREEAEQQKVLLKLSNQIDTQEKQRLNEIKRAEEERLKVLQKEREEAKKLADETERALGKTMKGRTSEVTVSPASQPGQIDTSSLKGYDWVAQYKERLAQQKKELDFMQQEVGAINSLADAWGSLWSCIGEGDSVLTQTMQAMGSAVQNFTNLFVQMSQIQFQAAQAGALSNATGEAMKLPPPYNFVAAATAVGTIMSMFSNFKSIGGFAEGGIVGGNSTIGDYNIARVNSGEMILNGTQQKRLFNLANGLGGSNETMETPQVEFKIKGQDLVGVFRNYNSKMNRVR